MHPGVILQFFERLEVFAYESVKKQEELTERIKREVPKTAVLLIMATTIIIILLFRGNFVFCENLQVSEACEKKLATQHKLAPGLRKDIDTTTEGWFILTHS